MIKPPVGGRMIQDTNMHIISANPPWHMPTLSFFAKSHSKSRLFRLPVKLAVHMFISGDAPASVTQSMQAVPEMLQPGIMIICTNSRLPGGDAETQHNPGRPGKLGRYDVYSHIYSQTCRIHT